MGRDQHAQPKTRGNITKAVAAAATILVIIGLLYYIEAVIPAHAITNSTAKAQAYEIRSCAAILNPGNYILAANISYSQKSGACIDIEASGVSLVGGGHSITGNASSSGQGAASYGIAIESQSNVSISQVAISKLSYGVYLIGSDGNRISNVSADSMTGAGIYLYGSSRNLLYNDSMKGDVGAINITGGGNNTLSVITAEYNLHYGISLTGSRGNRISRSVLLESHADMACGTGSNFVSSNNKFNDSSCYVNRFCNFARCYSSNIQYPVTNIVLGPAIGSCGSITRGGSYSLESDLNFAGYMNASLLGGAAIPCISINASNVRLQCNGHTIRNAKYGILSETGAYNVTISGCSLQNDTYGIYLRNVIKFGLRAINARGGTYGIYLFGADNGNLTNSSAQSNKYGVYFNNTRYDAISGFLASNDSYGVTLDNSTYVHLYNGTASANSNVDLYCTASAYGSATLSANDIKCGNTDCNWAGASCPVKVAISLSAYPLTECGNITVSRHYTVTGGIVARGSCFRVDASNVSINCTGNSDITSITGVGAAFEMDNVTNVTIEGCRISRFHDGIVAKGTKSIALKSMTIKSVINGVNISDSANALVSNDLVTYFSNQAYSIVNTNGSAMLNSKADFGPLGYAFGLSGAFNNEILNNTAASTGYGFYISDSRYNTIYNNSVYSASNIGYQCAPDSAGMYDQYGRINYGVTGAGCNWLVEVSPVYNEAICKLTTSPDTITFAQDMVYSYGGTCFSIRSTGIQSADGTTINCNGHKIFATNGGTFLYSYNTSGVTLENCILIGFTNPVVFASKTPVSKISIINNTFASSSNSSIYVANAHLSTVRGNNIMNSSEGIYLYGFGNSGVVNNSISAMNAGLVLNRSLSADIMNNTISNSSMGMIIANSQFTHMQGNRIYGSLGGVECYGNATSSTNKDLGGNVCPAVSGCSWMTASQLCR
ncbi:MAG: NosD domain-containing protein [Candidatus Micrarchaeaceae archaeon]